MAAGLPRTIRAVSVDFDDTLVFSEALKRRVLLDIASEFEGGSDAISRVNTDARVSGVKCTRHTIFRDFARELEALHPGGGGGASGPRSGPQSAEELGKTLAEKYSVRVEAAFDNVEEVPGARAVLEHMSSSGLPVFINSATPQAALRSIAERTGFTSLVREVLGSPDEGGDKVDNLRHVARELGLDPAEVLHIGDGDNDRDAAARFGCPFVLLASRTGQQASVPAGAAERAAGAAAKVPGCGQAGVAADMFEACALACDLAGIQQLA